MTRPSVWLLALLLFFAVPGPSPVEGKETATIVIAQGNSLLWQPEGRESLVYGPGDTIVAEWDNGDCYLNGRIDQSRVPPPPKDFPVTLVKQMYCFPSDTLRGEGG